MKRSRICAKAGPRICETPREQFYHQLPADIQRLADKNFALLKQDPQHPSLHFKKVGRFWSARVGIHFRAVAVQQGDDMVWFWIGRHDEYELIIGARR